MAIYNFRTCRQEMLQDIWHAGYLIYGPESFLIKQVIDEIVERFVAQEMRDVDLIKIPVDKNLTEDHLDRIKQELQTPAFLSERKIIIVEESGIFSRARKGQANLHKERIKQFEEVLSFMNQNTCLIMREETIDGRRKKLLRSWQEADGIQIEIQHEDLSVLRKWLQAKAQKKNLRLTQEAADSVIDRCDSQMAEIDKEFAKVLLYAEYADLSGIDINTIEYLCKADLRGSVFNLTDAVAAGNTKQALDLLNTLLMLKEPLPLIRFMFNRHIKQLICAKELMNKNQIIKKVGVYPFVAGRLMNQAKKLNMADLEYLYRLCFESDWQVKKGEMSDRLSFEILLIESALTFAGKLKREDKKMSKRGLK